MKDDLNIESLLKKLNSDTLSKGELDELIGLVYTELPDSILDEYFNKVWEKSSKEDNSRIVSSGLLGRIHKKLRIENPPVKERKLSARKLLSKSAVSGIMKYAAIVLVTFGLSFFIQRWMVGKPEQSVQHSQMNDISVPYGSKSKVVLPDGSLVNMNSGSHVRYSSDFHAKREIYLEGEAFFDVKKDPEHPFYVHTGEISIKVLGTQFDIKSYPEENIIETTVISGSVQILKNNSGKAEKVLLLKPNQSAVYIKDKGFTNPKQHEAVTGKLTAIKKASPRITIVSKIKPELYTAWKDNVLVFNNEEFKILIPKLERWYNIKIENHYPELNNSRLTGQFDLESIEQALDALNIITPFRYRIEKNIVTIYPEQTRI
jgi:transmembrane sensor